MTGSVRQSGSFDGLVRRVADGVAPMALDRMGATAEQIADNARTDWPVSKRDDRPHSRDLIETGDAAGDGKVVAFVLVPVDYAFYIKSYKNGLKGKSPWQELLRKPGVAAGKALAQVCAADLAKLAGGR